MVNMKYIVVAQSITVNFKGMLLGRVYIILKNAVFCLFSDINRWALNMGPVIWFDDPAVLS